MSTQASTGGGGGGSTGAGGSTGGGGYQGGAGGSTGAAASGWGDDWRQRLAGGDAEELKRLERFQGPENVYRSYRELESRMSRGELKPVLAKDATPEEQARWRAEAGIPTKPEDYKITLPEGRKPPAEDDAFLASFKKSAHEANYTQAQVDNAVRSFYAEVDRQEQAMTAAEKAAETAAEDALRKDWGNDYRVNKNMAEALLARAPAGFRDRFMNGYLADRTPIRASPDAWKWLVQIEREINPASTVVPNTGGDLGKTIDAEIAELKKQMGAPRGSPESKKYWEEGGEARYRQLIEAKGKMAARSGQAA